MAIPRLSWRLGLPFVLLVLCSSVALAAFTSRQLTDAEHQRFARVAVTIGAYIDAASLPTTVGLASDLRRVTGDDVLFRQQDRFEPQIPDRLRALPLATLAADRNARRIGRFLCIAVPVAGKHDLVVVREDDLPAIDPLVAQVVAAFAMLAILTTWLVARGLVRPLRRLAQQVPAIEAAAPLELPEAARPDEIGDLARALQRTQQALREERTKRERAEKLAVLGRMTAALAHEVQNPVAAIRMHAQLWRTDRSHDAAQTIEDETSRIENLLNQWLFLTRPEPPATAPFRLHELVTQVADSQRAQAEHAAVRLRVDVDASIVVDADRRRLQHVFRNLVTNAMQAMPAGGVVELLGRRRDGEVIVTCRDRGPGFTPTALRRLGEYFFSEREGGMGIGLAVATEIVKAHGGALRADNHHEGGAVVAVTLPLAAIGAGRA